MILQPVNLDQQLFKLFFYHMSYTKSSKKNFRYKQSSEFILQKVTVLVALAYSKWLRIEKPYHGYFCIKYHVI